MKLYSVAMLGLFLLVLSSCMSTRHEYSVSFPIDQTNVVTVEYIDEPILSGPKKQPVEKLFAGVLFGECRGDADCLNAVGHVILNRVRAKLDTRYGQGLWGVLNKRKAFSCLLRSDNNRPVIDAAMRGELDADTPDGRAWAKAKKVAHRLLYVRTFDPTNDATHYHATYVAPRWAHDRGMIRLAKIGSHIFYRKDA